MKIDTTRLLEEARARAKPIDFEALERLGALKRRSKYWYEVVDASKVPDYVFRQARGFRNEKSSVSIKLPTSWKRAQQVLEKMGREFG